MIGTTMQIQSISMAKKEHNPVIKGVIYDENGQRTFTSNVDILTLEMSDRLLVNSYRNTIYQRALFLEAIDLQNSGVDFEVQGYEFEPELIQNALKSMHIEILNRFGKEYYEQLQEQILEKDLAFLKNKPDSLKH